MSHEDFVFRDFRPQQLYGVTQRGNQGRWVYRDDQDFRKALDLMARFAARYEWLGRCQW